MALRMNDEVVAILEYFKHTRTIEYTNNRIYYTIIIRIYHCIKMHIRALYLNHSKISIS